MAVSKSVSVYKTKPFSRFARKARIDDVELWKGAQLANQGMIDADLGGGVIKLRVARSGQGKSSGSRTILLFKKNDRAIYVHGFEKKDIANIRPDELEAIRKFGAVYLACSSAEMARRVADGALLDVEMPKGEINE